jgi:hypothetical protein
MGRAARAAGNAKRSTASLNAIATRSRPMRRSLTRPYRGPRKPALFPRGDLDHFFAATAFSAERTEALGLPSRRGLPLACTDSAKLSEPSGENST